jgi:tetratricopeptide (TPR) repeat protein
MYLNGRHLRLRKPKRRSDPKRVAILIVLILTGFYVNSLVDDGTVQPLFTPTSEPTRVPASYAEEAEAHFAAGNLKAAIAVYRSATGADPKNLDYRVALARIQIYDGQYEEALESADLALLMAPNDAKSKAIQAWALYFNVDGGCRCKTLPEAESAAIAAIALDANYAPAHAYYSEILNASQKWSQGYQAAETALRLDPRLLEAHRAMGIANEHVGNYSGAIEHYKNALKINPNLITLYIRLGLNYRVTDIPQAIYYFSKANAIDPTNIDPYLYLSRTHYQNDELGTAIQYLQQALRLEPANPDIHGRLGLILFRRRNYEGAEPELRLAVMGGVVDGNGRPLLDAEGNPLLDASGNPVQPADGVVLQVAPLPLAGSITLEYYYTYGNLLAYLQKCGPDEAPRYLTLALNFAPDEPTVQGSYNESMGLCQAVLSQRGGQGTAANPTAGPAEVVAAPTPTAAPAQPAVSVPAPTPEPMPEPTQEPGEQPSGQGSSQESSDP